jgi:hypothetical protein
MIPTSTATFSEEDFHAIVDEETQTYIVPLLMEVREEYLVVTQDITVTADTDEYFIPERAVAGKLRDVTLSDGNGGYKPLTRLEPENIDVITSDSSGVGGYYLQGNKIILAGSISGTLRVSYYQRPNRVVATTAVGEITAINTSTRVVTVSGTCPATFTTSVSYDFVKGKPGFDTLGKDFSASAVGASSVTFSSTLPTGLAVGDFICIAQETPIAQVPVELHPLLAQRVAATILHAMGDAKAKVAYELAADMEKRALKMLTPRTEGSNRYVMNRYGVGWNKYNSRKY